MLVNTTLSGVIWSYSVVEESGRSIGIDDGGRYAVGGRYALCTADWMGLEIWMLRGAHEADYALIDILI